jgi:hypothetical protein
MTINVAWNYGGNITGLFYTGTDALLPAQIAEHTWRVKDHRGYDAQYYHLIAHDPLILRDFAPYVDNPRVRWRRIGMPGLAALASAGNERHVDSIYVALQLVFTFLGAWWLSQYARSVGWHPLSGLAFLLIPAVPVSLDRMTVDLALAALSIGFVRYGAGRMGGTPVAAVDRDGRVRSAWAVYGILLLAPLIRETGMLLVFGWCTWTMLQRRWKEIIAGAACALPAVGWWVYVHSRTVADGTAWLSRYPFSGLIERTVSGDATPSTTLWLRTAGVTENLAFAGIWIALFLGVYLAWRRRYGLLELTAILFVAFASLLGKYDIWDTAYAVGRTMSPLLVMLLLIGMRERRIVYFLPVLMIFPRLALQYQAQLTAAFRNML